MNPSFKLKQRSNTMKIKLQGHNVMGDVTRVAPAIAYFLNENSSILIERMSTNVLRMKTANSIHYLDKAPGSKTYKSNPKKLKTHSVKVTLNKLSGTVTWEAR
jgi:hypothetical protein